MTAFGRLRLLDGFGFNKLIYYFCIQLDHLHAIFLFLDFVYVESSASTPYQVCKIEELNKVIIRQTTVSGDLICGLFV